MFNPWVGKISWRRKWQSTPIFLPGKPHRLGAMGHKGVGHDLAAKQQQGRGTLVKPLEPDLIKENNFF